jgi:hypothetical protein
MIRNFSSAAYVRFRPMTFAVQELLFDRATTYRQITCHVDETFNLAFVLGRLLADGNLVPFDLTGWTLQFFIRPFNDHETLILKVESGIGTDTITIAPPPTDGKASILIAQATMATIFPSASGVFRKSHEPYVAHQALRAKQGTTYIECWRGELIVKPYRTL